MPINGRGLKVQGQTNLRVHSIGTQISAQTERLSTMLYVAKSVRLLSLHCPNFERSLDAYVFASYTLL